MGSAILQPTFTGGELSPSLYARVDLARYGTSVRKASNFIVRPYGGLVNRTGFGFVGEVKDSAHRVRLLPFVFSTEVAYVMELGGGYMRFIFQGEYVVDGLGVPIEVVTPWTGDVLDEVAITQSADVVYMTHSSAYPVEIRRTGASTFEVRQFANKLGPFSPINADESRTIACSAETGNITIASTADIFNADMVGSLFYIEEKDLRGQRPWEPNWRNVTVGTLCRSDGKVYRCVTVPGGAPTYRISGGVRPIHDSGRAWDGPQDTRTAGADSYTVGYEWEYLHSGFGVVLITGFTDAKNISAQVTSRIPASCVGGLGSPGTTWNLVGTGVAKTFAIVGAISESTADYTVTINGVPVQADPYYEPPIGTGGGSRPGGGGWNTQVP
jgi:hypothetical protein